MLPPLRVGQSKLCCKGGSRTSGVLLREHRQTSSEPISIYQSLHLHKDALSFFFPWWDTRTHKNRRRIFCPWGKAIQGYIPKPSGELVSMGTSTYVKTPSLSLSSMGTYKNTRINLPVHKWPRVLLLGETPHRIFYKKRESVTPTSDDGAFCWGCWTWSLFRTATFFACPNYSIVLGGEDWTWIVFCWSFESQTIPQVRLVGLFVGPLQPTVLSTLLETQ